METVESREGIPNRSFIMLPVVFCILGGGIAGPYIFLDFTGTTPSSSSSIASIDWSLGMAGGMATPYTRLGGEEDVGREASSFSMAMGVVSISLIVSILLDDDRGGGIATPYTLWC